MIKVQPIRELDQIARIRRNLKGKKNAVLYCLFVLGINTNLRVSDLRNLRWESLWLEGSHELRALLTLTEKKTGKRRRIKLTEPMIEAIHYLLDNLPRTPERTDPVFRNPVTKGAYSREHLSRRIRAEAGKVGIDVMGDDPIGMHSLRKTWGFHAVVTFHQPLALVQAGFNHSSQALTLDYCCIRDVDIEVVYETVAL